MGDRSAVSIDIGGTLDRALLPELWDVVAEDGGYEDWEGAFDDEAELYGYVERVAKDGVHLTFLDNERSGSFDMLEAFCRDHGLSYRQRDSGHYIWSPYVQFWEPAMGPVPAREWGSDVDLAEPTASIRQLEKAMTDGSLDDELALMCKVASFDVPLVLVGEKPGEG